jgi:hypothetical protein
MGAPHPTHPNPQKSHWTNRNIASSINGKKIVLNLWEKLSLEFTDSDPAPIKTIFYDSADMIILIVDCGMPDSADLIKHYYTDEIAGAYRESSDYLQIPTLVIADKSNIDYMNLEQVEMSLFGGRWQECPKSRANFVKKDQAVGVRKASFVTETSRELDCKNRDMFVRKNKEKLKELCMGMDWYIDCMSQEKDLDEVLKTFALKCYSMGVKVQGISSGGGESPRRRLKIAPKSIG